YGVLLITDVLASLSVRRGGAIKLQRPHVACEPVRQRFAARGLRIRAAARAHSADKQMRPERLLAARAIDRHRASGVVDKQLFAREVALAHRALQALRPGTVDLAERAAAVGRRAVTPLVLLPQQLQRHVPVTLEF